MDQLMAMWQFATAYHPILSLVFLAWGSFMAREIYLPHEDQGGRTMSRGEKSLMILIVAYIVGALGGALLAALNSGPNGEGFNYIWGNQMWMMTLPILAEQCLYLGGKALSPIRAWFARWKQERAEAHATSETAKQRERKEILERFDNALSTARASFVEGRDIKEFDDFIRKTDGWRALLEQLLDRRAAIDGLLREMGHPDAIDEVVEEIDAIEPDSSLVETSAKDIAAAKKAFANIKTQRAKIGAGIEGLLLKAEMLCIQIASAKTEVVLTPPEEEEESSLRSILAEPLQAFTNPTSVTDAGSPRGRQAVRG